MFDFFLIFHFCNYYSFSYIFIIEVTFLVKVYIITSSTTTKVHISLPTLESLFVYLFPLNMVFTVYTLFPVFIMKKCCLNPYFGLLNTTVKWDQVLIFISLTFFTQHSTLQFHPSYRKLYNWIFLLLWLCSIPWCTNGTLYPFIWPASFSSIFIDFEI